MSHPLLLMVLLFSTLAFSLPAQAEDGAPTAALPAPAGIDINELEDYTQWKQALGAGEGTDPATFLVPPGFEIERLRSAAPEEGSWISVACDSRGRLIIAKEERGLLRVTLPDPDQQDNAQPLYVETVDDTLLECRGLLFAFDALYVNANNSKGLYRLRDTNGDDRFDETTLLYRSEGGSGHGRNALALGPDGMIYSIHGDSVELPTDCPDATSPLRARRRGAPSREGHVLRMDRDGKNCELVAAGLRNPFGIDFNADGELFTYDADAEHDMGAPWYRPTRIVHLVHGGDFGWRAVTGSWPPYYPDQPDNAVPNLDIGRGSPTAVKFGTSSRFPAPLREALFALDWSYGRILAVHMTPSGASYECRAETFLKGRPLNVTGLDFGPDGAMYFVTGGRKTQSALYRVRYVGLQELAAQGDDQPAAIDSSAAEARRLRRELETQYQRQTPRSLDFAWSHLRSSDPWLRHAARIAVEHQPLDAWRERALAETDVPTAVTALMALARSHQASLVPRIVSRLCELPLEQLATDDLLAALYTVELCLDNDAPLTRPLQTQLAEKLNAMFPSSHSPVSQRLSGLLVRLSAPDVIENILQLLSTSTNQAEQLHYLFVLRSASGWTHEQRLRFVAAWRRMASFQGGEGMPKFRQQIRTDWLATLSDHERADFERLLEDEPFNDLPAASDRPLVKHWQLDDLVDSLSEVGESRDLQRGKQLFTAALCIRCHRMGLEGGSIGPDLTALARRFSRRDILESILLPSKVVAEQYRTVRITTQDGRLLVGQVIPSTDFRSPKLRLATDPLRPNEIVEIDKQEIESHDVSPLSTMPEGLLNTLTREEILDLLAYLESP